MANNPIARARVTVTVEVDCVGPWGRDCTIGRVHDQARKEAVAKLRRFIEQARGARVAIGREPEVSVIIWSNSDGE